MFNVTATPLESQLGYLTIWNSDYAQPTVSTLNAPGGTPTSNMAILYAGSGSISAYATNNSDLKIDVAGVFVPVGNGFLDFYAQTPCRALDTRTVGKGQPITGQYGPVDIIGSGCVTDPNAIAYAVNATVIPTSKLAYLDLWNPDAAEPSQHLLGALDGQVTSNATLVSGQQGNKPLGAVSAYASASTQLLLDVYGYWDFANLTITTSSLPDGTVGVFYSTQLMAQAERHPTLGRTLVVA